MTSDETYQPTNQKTDPSTTLYYTFGNHMHWVDMQWLWGYQVLPDSVRDMLMFCNETGAKGHINFEGIGYEKMAAEAPDALAELRAAVESGQIEIVGASYGQPYGLFHGGESNIRQRVYGVRSVLKLFGTRPRTFWEEEFDFFPQLPQMLTGTGYQYASLFFQWTWHTPEIPHETVPAIWWVGQDGSRLLTAPRHPLNLHQWPEDFAGLLDKPLLHEMPQPLLLQWLELMPSPDWMCRAELMLPQLKALAADQRFELNFITLPEYLEKARQHAEPRQYTMDDVFHGMSLGKNGDFMRRQSRRAEEQLLAAESISALMGLFGRPYPHWDVYPVWELEEAWRELLAAQHHDNEECEGLCGHVGKFQYTRSMQLSGHVLQRALQTLADRTRGSAGRTIFYNPLGWERTVPQLREPVPPFGYVVVDDAEQFVSQSPVTVTENGTQITLRRGKLAVTVDRQRGLLTQIQSDIVPDGILRDDMPLLQLQMQRDGETWQFEQADVSVDRSGTQPTICIRRHDARGAMLNIRVSLAEDADAVDVSFDAQDLPRTDSRMHAALQTGFTVNLPDIRLIHDHPYGLSEIHGEGSYRRKYPSGEWMTSPQEFEDVHNPFTALTLLDITNDAAGLLCLHDGSQGFIRDGDTVNCILTMYDAWDEEYFNDTLQANFRLVPHAAMNHVERWRLAQEFTRPVLKAKSNKSGGDLPQRWTTITCDAPNVALSSLYRESVLAGDGLPDYATTAGQHPYILRLVEFNGESTTATITLPGEIAAAYKTNLLGEVQHALDVEINNKGGLPASALQVTLRPYEIATIYFDWVPGRKIPRNLDDHRHIWATVHREDEQGG